jgi:hypothetical protein
MKRKIDMPGKELPGKELLENSPGGKMLATLDEAEANKEKGRLKVLVSRALAAWYRSGGTDRPDGPIATPIVGNKQYIVLKSHFGVVAVYRLLNTGQLKRLKRWPEEVEA